MLCVMLYIPGTCILFTAVVTTITTGACDSLLLLRYDWLLPTLVMMLCIDAALYHCCYCSCCSALLMCLYKKMRRYYYCVRGAHTLTSLVSPPFRLRAVMQSFLFMYYVSRSMHVHASFFLPSHLLASPLVTLSPVVTHIRGHIAIFPPSQLLSVPFIYITRRLQLFLLRRQVSNCS